MSVLARWLFVLVAIGCGTPAGRPAAMAAAPAASEDRCGNGIVDPGELCDPNVKWAERCPEPWGICWKCSPACNARVASPSEPVHGFADPPFCEERQPLGGTTVQTYDEFGRLLSRRRSGSNRVDVVLLEYDTRGRIVMLDSDGGGSRSRLHHVFEGDLRVRSWDDVDLDGKADRTWHYTYSEDGRMLRETSHDSDRRFSYDSDGNRIGDISTFPETEWHSTTQLTYDERGRLTREVHGSSSLRAEPSIDCRNTYHANGSRRCCRIRGSGINSDPCWERDRFGEAIMHSDGTMTTRSTNEYDKRGLLTRHTERVGSEQLFTEWRGYDDLANLLVREINGGTNNVTRTEYSHACLRDVYPRMPMRAFTERR